MMMYIRKYCHVGLYELQGHKKLKDKPEYVPLANQFFQRASPVQKHLDSASFRILSCSSKFIKFMKNSNEETNFAK